MEQERIIRADRLKNFCVEVLTKLGVSQADAVIIIDAMVEGNLRGVDTHGVVRLPGLIRMLREGNANPRPNIRVICETAATAMLDADDAPGNLAATKAMELAINKARTASVAAITVKNTTHCGALASFTMLAAQQGMIGFMTSNGPRAVPPYGSRTRALSTNPWCFAVPAGNALPIVLDMATTVASGGKIRLAAKKGEKIPLTWALDKDGVPTDDPVKALAGSHQWLGGAKGYGLAVMTDVLAGVLSGGPFVNSMPEMTEPYGSSIIRQGNFILALNIAAFMPLNEFTARIDRLVKDLKSCEPAPGVKEVLLPGERSFKTKAERLKSGIPIPPAVWKDLEHMRDEFHIASPLG
ncbi:MAG: Ldh family oxidoreductase [Dehalococcoidales bacterium]|nr:Ldh family oxidoreductase [Dehalococcoidales bacterium]